jgi:anti-sigma regulatory factor (Ser/Thr protein kinase)/N-acetylglutamate synthase-like GNAT family acetyltransferase
MDAHLKLKANTGVIGSTSDFTYKWAINAGLPADEAARLTLAVTEIVTNVILHAYPHDVGELEVTYRQDLTQVEIVIHDFGEPFDPDRHRYDRKRALIEGHFEGAGLAIAERMVDKFMFLYIGKSGKEFRLLKNIPAEHIADIIPESEKKIAPVPDVTEEYHLSVATPDDAEDIAKLIYRTYGYTYAKDDIYFPKKNELALERGEKFAVMVRTSNGEAVAHFAVLRSSESNIGEVAEVAVSPHHRRRGLMTRMLNALIGVAKKNGLSAVYGEAVTVHLISQIVNHKLGFHSSALMLACFPVTKYRDLVETYSQDVSVVIDFLLLSEFSSREAYLPPKYADILSDIYARHGIRVVQPTRDPIRPGEQTQFDLHIRYDNKTATVVIEDYGTDLVELISGLSVSLREEGINTIYVDMPLDHPGTKTAARELDENQFLFCGLMFFFHKDRDYLRMQHTTSVLDMSQIFVHSDMAKTIKRRIEKEMQWIMKSTDASSASV